MKELEEAFKLVEIALEKASKEACSLALTRQLKLVRDELNIACQIAEIEMEEINGSKEEDI